MEYTIFNLIRPPCAPMSGIALLYICGFSDVASDTLAHITLM